MVKPSLLNRFVVTPLLVVIVAAILFSMIQPLAQPAINAAQRSIESLQVAHAAAPQFPKSSTIGDVYNNAAWYSVNVMGAKNSYNCRPTASMNYMGYQAFHKLPINGECTPEGIGNFLEDFFKKIREAIKDAPADIQTKIEASINALREAAIKQGVVFPPTP